MGLWVEAEIIDPLEMREYIRDMAKKIQEQYE